MSNQLNIILNGKNIKGNPGESILQLAKRNGIEIPTLCNDPRLKPFSSCFVCVVEVEGMKGMQPSCSTKIQEGMKVETEKTVPEAIQKLIKTALVCAAVILVGWLIVRGVTSSMESLEPKHPYPRNFIELFGKHESEFYGGLR